MPKTLMEFQQKPSLELRPKLMMTAHMQQAIRLLQIPVQELDLFLEEQVINNPLLELDDPSEEVDGEDPQEKELFNSEMEFNENDFTILKQLGEEWQDNFESEDRTSVSKSFQDEKLRTFLESSISSEISLQEHLKQEINDIYNEPTERHAGEILIGYIDHSGFLTTPIEEISAFHGLDSDLLKKILKTIQSLEPHGMGAASIQESLLLQLAAQSKENSLAYKIIHDHYDDFLHHRLRSIQKKLNSSFQDIQDTIDHTIAKLDLHPGYNFSSTKSGIIIPDLTITQEDDKLTVEVNRDHYHHLHFNFRYLQMLDNPDIPLETKNFIKHHLLSAKWLIRNLQQRYSTLERIAILLTQKQHSFFIDPEGKLLPLTMNDVAEELQLHESTIARSVSNKYIHTPRGLLSLRSFFTTAYTSDKGEILSGKTVQDAIQALINNENKKEPLSDEQISIRLREEGLLCARRTVAKHRNLLDIGNTTQRRRY